MSNNRCKSCTYKEDPVRIGHCYMFRIEPKVCNVFTPEDKSIDVLSKLEYVPQISIRQLKGDTQWRN